ncbi:hypothetical protein [Nocardiopsis halotolerans]|uniref:hypothetical protein n=1 Tax=Nocardiopsis halotolerans TaxID=124252 RepID=UPI000364B0FF|nr:hypothetical protein [Nocardiopsis halotolerans]
MTHRPHAPVAVPRAILLAAIAAFASVLLAHLLGWAVSQLMEAAHTAPDANIGAALALLLLPVPLAAVLVWPLVRTVRLPYPAITALTSTPPYLLLSVGVWRLWTPILDRVPVDSPLSTLPVSVATLALANAVALTAVLATVAVFTTRHHARAFRRR